MKTTEQMKERLIESLFIKQAIKECVKILEKNTEYCASETSCGRMLIGEDEEVEVRIVVVRDEKSFLGDFEIVNHRYANENQH